MKKVETRLQLDPTLDDWLTRQAAIAGIAKTRYIIQVIEDLKSNAAHTHSNYSIKLSNMDSDLHTEVSAIKARLSKLENATHLPPTEAVEDRPKFYKGQPITGQSSKLYELVWSSFEATQKVNLPRLKGTYRLSNKLGIICKTVGTSRSGKSKLEVWLTFPDDKVILNPDGTFFNVSDEKGVEWFTEKELAALAKEKAVTEEQPIEPSIEQPKIAIEPTNDETPTEVAIEIPSPIHEPQIVEPSIMSFKDLQHRYGIFGQAKDPVYEAARGDGWQSPDGLVWLLNEDLGKMVAHTNSTSQIDEPVDQAQVSESTATQDKQLELPTAELAIRLAAGDDKAVQGLAGTLQNVGGEKMKSKAIKDWTSQHDPDGLPWMPTDATRETWISQPVAAS